MRNCGGEVFGRLTVLTPQAIWASIVECQCQCGEKTKVLLVNLINGNTKSCGCLRREIPSEKKVKHGFVRNNMATKKGRRLIPPEYWVWQGMLNRCRNPKAISYTY